MAQIQISKVVLIAGNAEVAELISQIFRKEGSYFTVFESPVKSTIATEVFDICDLKFTILLGKAHPTVSHGSSLLDFHAAPRCSLVRDSAGGALESFLRSGFRAQCRVHH